MIAVWLPPEPIPLTLDAEPACQRGHVALRLESGRLYCAVCQRRRHVRRREYWRAVSAAVAALDEADREDMIRSQHHKEDR